MMKNRFQKMKKGVVLLFLMVPVLTFAQNVTVNGIVSDKNGDPITGVTVAVSGTSNATMTDIDGAYKISAPTNGKLSFSFVGYTQQTIEINGRNVIDVTLSEDAIGLQEVVAIGYGTQRREAVTGSVASMQGNTLREVQAGNITAALQGRISGVVMTQTNSQPGASMQIRIRGTRSLNATNDPLVVLDGIPYPGTIGDINPNDIKSIDILKDASATAIYGSRGANGVIMVTTYKGYVGQKARVTYDSYYGVETLFHRYPMMSGDELYKLRGVAGKYTSKDADGNLVPQIAIDEAIGQNTDWQKLNYRTGMVTNHNIGVSGGTETASYRFGGGYYKQTSLLPGQDYNRFSLNGNLDQQVGKYFKIGFTTKSNYAITNGQNLSAGFIGTSPLINPYKDDGTWKIWGGDLATPAGSWLYSGKSTNALGDSYADNQKTFGTYNSAYGEIKIPGIDGLSYRINVGLNYWTLNRGQYTGEGIMNKRGNPSSAHMQQQANTNWAVENLLIYDKLFGKHHINLTALYSGEQTTQTQTQIDATKILADFFQYYNMGQVQPAESGSNVTVDPGRQYLRVYGLVSWMGRAMYDYDNRYMLSVAMRGDGSSRLAPGHQWHTYPAISVGWNIANEQFMKNLKWFDILKLRAGWGQTSNQAINPYQTLGQLTTQPYNFGSTQAVGVSLSLAPNPDLGWEYSKTWNFGLDFGFFHNRISGSIDYYKVNTSNLLYTISLPPTAGVGSQTTNVGSSQNKGLEINLNATVFDNPNGWSWDVGINFAANQNEITGLGSGVKQDVGNFFFVGNPINVIFDYQKIGIWQANDPYLNILEPGGNVGMIKVLYTGTYNADGTPTRQINSGTGHEDRQIMPIDPKWQGGFSTRVGYKNMDLTVIGAYQHGGLLISSLYNSAGYLNNLTGQVANVQVNYWTPTNTSGTFPLPGGVQATDGPKYGSTLGYFDASYLKVSTITLGYNFTPDLMKKVGIESARLYVTCQNAFVLFSPYTKQSGQDPVTNTLANNNVNSGNMQYVGRYTVLPMVGYNTPQTRNFLLGLNLSF